jgi:hypothetical protein
MSDRLTRVVGGAAERLCWRFVVRGKADPDYELASSAVGPFDPDRARRLKRGETFQRLDPSGRPRVYDGLSWQRVTVAPAHQEAPKPPAQPVTPASSVLPCPEGAGSTACDEGHRSMSYPLLLSEIHTAEHVLSAAEGELAEAVGAVPAAPRAEKTVMSDRVEGALDTVKASRSKLDELKLLFQLDEEP